jgi:hypothetical protein
LLRRRNVKYPYSIFTSRKNSLAAYALKVSAKLGNSENPDAFTGIIFMAQSDGKGAFIVEFNAKQQYRLRQLVGVNYKIITGTAKNGGWVHADALKPPGTFNLIEVRTANRNYDLYINQRYMISFSEIAYKSGGFGFSVGPDTKASVDFIRVYQPAEGSDTK